MVYSRRIDNAAIGAALLMLSGCAGGEIQKFTIGPSGVRAAVTAEANAVTAKLSKFHFDNCQRQVEKKNIIGDQFKITTPFKRSLRHSCAAIYPPNPLSVVAAGSGYKRVAYVATRKRVSGYGSYDRLAVCVFKMKNGRILLDKYSRYTKLPSQHICHQI